jgi:hypothetical protein
MAADQDVAGTVKALIDEKPGLGPFVGVRTIVAPRSAVTTQAGTRLGQQAGR